MKVYTKTGDKGTTALVGGERVSKHDVRVEAYGTVDELTAFVAHLHDLINEHSVLSESMTSEKRELLIIIERLMRVGTLFASPSELQSKMPPIEQDDISHLEQALDKMGAESDKIFRFTLPVGNSVLSACHIARTICRRAERRALEAEQSYDLPKKPIVYLNRLSDYLYMLTKVIARKASISEITWGASGVGV